MRRDDTQRKPDNQVELGVELIVGIGGSAGSLEPLEDIMRPLSATLPAAFVVVQHLDPHHRSRVGEILARETSLRVGPVISGAPLRAGHVYVTEPGTVLTLTDDTLQKRPPASPFERLHAIDVFFETLAIWQDRAMAVLLSGAGNDGTRGLKRIKVLGGCCIVQDPDTARFEGMPESAILAGAADQVLPPAAMAAVIRDRAQQLKGIRNNTDFAAMLRPRLDELCAALEIATGNEVGLYKETTLMRRIERRMQICHTTSVDAYLRIIKETAQEAAALHRDLLIGVTDFFRDAEAFAALEHLVITPLCETQALQLTPLRIWVPACASGQEAYSLAMLLLEHVRAAHHDRLQVFATDLDHRAIEMARQGRYSREQVEQLSGERVRRFFNRVDDEYVVSDELRSVCIFSEHDLLKDPPFSRINLISCRNLFIYLVPRAQARIIPTFHYALVRHGFLFLGGAESIVGPANLFRTIDKRSRIFKRQEVDRPAVLSFKPRFAHRQAERETLTHHEDLPVPGRELTQSIATELLETHAPPAVVINEVGEVLFYSGRTGCVLEAPTGAPSNNLFDLTKRCIRPQLHALVHQAVTTQREATHPRAVLIADHETLLVDLVVRPLKDLVEEPNLYLVVFRPAHASTALSESAQAEALLQSPDSVAQHLEAELSHTRDTLQATIEKLKASNEELLSTNEELQSANEELQTSKEEFQSLNDDLENVNAELSHKVEQLARVNSDLRNFFENTQVPTLFLDTQLRIQKYTPATERVFRLITTDIGRPFSDVAATVDTSILPTVFEEVLRSLVPAERALTTLDESTHYLMRVNPYRTVTDVISGLVVTFSDVTDLKKAQERETTLAAIVESSSDAIIGCDIHGHIQSWNGAAERLFCYKAAEVLGESIDILSPAGSGPRAAELAAMVQRNEAFCNREMTRVRRDGHQLCVSYTLSPVRKVGGRYAGFSLICRDVTERRRYEIERNRMAAIVESSDDAIVGETLNGIITSWNSGAERLLGYSAAEMVGASIERLVPSNQPEDVKHILAKVGRGEAVKHYETVRVHKDRRHIHVSLSVSPIRDGSGVIIGAAKIARDMTERARAEETLRRGLALRDEFIAIASHELKTPLTSMMLQTGMLKRVFNQNSDGNIPQSKVMKFAEQVEHQLHRLVRLVDDMLEVSRFERHRLTLTRTPGDLSQLLADTLESLQHDITAARCTLICNIQPDVTGVWDQVRIEQLVMNLVNNVCKHAAGSTLHVRLSASDTDAHIEVTDDGPGIALSDQERIFERFERGPDERRERSGFGIGLYLVRQVAVAHGGDVHVISKLREGSTFIVRLPRGGRSTALLS